MRHFIRSTAFPLLALAVAASAHAQVQPPSDTITIRGTISSVPTNGRGFVMTDRSGAQVTVTVNASTRYTLGNTDAKFVDVVIAGDRANVTTTSAGIAVEVNNRNRASRMSSDQLKTTLEITDDECAVLVPLIAKVQTLEQLTSRNGVNGSDIRTAFDAVRGAVRDPNASTTDIAARLKTLRDAKAKAEKDLVAARGELVSMLTLRQEALLVQMGILE
jgi:hypothetical protein